MKKVIFIIIIALAGCEIIIEQPTEKPDSTSVSKNIGYPDLPSPMVDSMALPGPAVDSIKPQPTT